MSLTIIGLLTTLIVAGLGQLGVEATQEGVGQYVSAAALLIGGAMTYYGRWRKGDITWWGGRKGNGA